MPQPYRYRFLSLKTPPDALLERPKLAVKIALVAAMWQSVENDLANIFMHLLGSEEHAALEIFNSLIDRNLRKEALVAVAKNRLPPPLLERATALFGEARRHANRRNMVVHATWATISVRPESLMRVDEADILRFRHLIQNQSLERAFANHIGAPVPEAKIGSDVEVTLMEYRERDFDEILALITSFRTEVIRLSVEVLSHIVSAEVTARVLSLSPQVRMTIAERLARAQVATEQSPSLLPSETPRPPTEDRG